MRYPYLLFDADNTLFDFDRSNRVAFNAVCAAFSLPDDDETFALYERCNNAMWAAFDRGECTKDFLVVQRFRNFLAALGVERDPAACNQLHLHTLEQQSYLLSHAEEVCRELSRSHKLYLVTNAVASVQRSRLGRSVIRPYISDAFISEEAGAAKPDPAYFDYVFARIGGITKENCIVIGDSLSSDMQGGRNAGIATCYYGKAENADDRCDYVIGDLLELLPIVENG